MCAHLNNSQIKMCNETSDFVSSLFKLVMEKLWRLRHFDDYCEGHMWVA